MLYQHKAPAKPLDAEMLKDLVDEGLTELIVYIDEVPYCDEDLYGCDGCELRTPDYADLNDDGLCEECAKEAAEEAEHMRQLRADYQASVL